MSIRYKLKHRPRSVNLVSWKDMVVLGTRNNSVRERLFTEKDLELR
jgi:hypothetical protein